MSRVGISKQSAVLARDHVVVKLDFRNAFNSLRMDRMLEAVAKYCPEIYAFCMEAYSYLPTDHKVQ